MKTILVGIDGSRESQRAQQQAIELGKQTGAKLLLAFAVPPPRADAPLLPEYGEGDRELRQQGRAVLDRVRRDAAARGVDAAIVPSEGEPADALASIAGTSNVDLVVIGHRSRSKVSRAVLGSTADRLLQISPRPVMVVR